LDVSQMGVSSFASVHINVVNGDTDSLLTFGSATSINLGSVLVVGHTTLSAMDFIFGYCPGGAAAIRPAEGA
jgi:hypothetical protein